MIGRVLCLMGFHRRRVLPGEGVVVCLRPSCPLCLSGVEDPGPWYPWALWSLVLLGLLSVTLTVATSGGWL